MHSAPRAMRFCFVVLAVVLTIQCGCPSVLAAGPIAWEQTSGPAGGSVTALVMRPDLPDTIFAGTLNGVYRSGDGGASWTHLDQGELGCLEVAALALDPLDGQAVYAGGNNGLFRSMDGGDSWVRIGAGLASDLVLSLAVHPREPGTLFAGMEDGLYQSVDRGENWGLAGRGAPQSSVWSLAIQPSAPYTLYAGTDGAVYTSADAGKTGQTMSRGLLPDERVQVIALEPRDVRTIYVGTSRGILRSIDGGSTWHTTGLNSDHDPVSALVVDPSRKDILYANIGLRGVWRSVEGAAGWTALNAVNGGRLVLALAVHPRDPQTLYAGAGHGLLKSSDGGATWTSSQRGMINSDVRQLVDVPKARGQLYAATRWGVYRTADEGKTWLESSVGLADPNILNLAIDPADTHRLYAATWDGQIYRSENGGDTWIFAHGPLAKGAEITALLVARPAGERSGPAMLYAAAEDVGVFRSLDLGQTWEELPRGLPSVRMGRLALASADGSLYLGVGNAVYRQAIARDAGNSRAWERITPQPLDGRVASIFFARVAGRRSDYVATDVGSIYVSENNEADWRYLARNALPANARIESLTAISRGRKPPWLCAITEGGIYSSQDQGQTWSLDSVGCLQQAMVRCLALDDRVPGTYYLGTARSGVYRGRDAVSRLSLSPRLLVWLIPLLAFVGGIFLARRRLGRIPWPRRDDLLAQHWDTWNDAIAAGMVVAHRVSADSLVAIPAQARVVAMRRYVDLHRDQGLIFREDLMAIEPANWGQLQQFVGNWAALGASLGNPKNATPLAARLTEQLCELLGFSPLESRSFRALHGYMVKAPAVRLNIPSRFPIICLLKRDLGEEDLADVRDLMSVMNVTSFFALLIIVDDAPGRRERAREIKRMVRGGADDLIVLDYQDLHSLFLARDAERRLIDLVLEQVDLTVVSPYVVSGPVPENMFFGRDYELKAVMRTVRDRSFAIVGGRKIGKTSVLSKVRRLMEGSSGFAPYYLDCQQVTNYEQFFRTLAAMCQVTISSDAPDVLRHVLLRLRRQDNSLIVFLLDEVDSLLAYDIRNQTRLFRMFRALSQEGLCRFVFCGERELNRALHDPTSPLFNFANTMRLSYLTPSAARRIIEEPMTIMGVTFQDAEKLPQGIIDLSSCHPNLVQAICKMLIMRINARHDRVIQAGDLQEVRVSDEFRDFYFEVTWGNASDLERLITVVMATTTEFGPAEARQALATRGCALPIAWIEGALENLVLLSILQKQGGCFSFAARSFATILAESQLAETYSESLIEKLQTPLGRA